MTYSFFYFTGFGITYLGSSWKATLLINIVLFLICELLNNTKHYALFIGWIAAVFIPERLTDTTSDIFHFTASTHINILLYTLECIVYTFASSAVFAYDNSTILLVGLLAFHVIYVYILRFMNDRHGMIDRVSKTHVDYYALFVVALAVSDIVYIGFSLFTHHGSTLMSTLTAAIVAPLVCFVYAWSLTPETLPK